MNRAPMSGHVRSILAMLMAMLFFALMDVVLKQPTAHYTVWRIRWPLHVLRCVMGIVMTPSSPRRCASCR